MSFLEEYFPYVFLMSHEYISKTNHIIFEYPGFQDSKNSIDPGGYCVNSNLVQYILQTNI
jgi:hypothetical protein